MAQMAPMKMVWVVAIAVPVAGIDAIVIAVTRRGQKAVTATHNDIFDIFGRISMLLRIRKNAAVAVAGKRGCRFWRPLSCPRSLRWSKALLHRCQALGEGGLSDARRAQSRQIAG